jgi:DNA-binding MarR family transcriptional regulator
VDERAESLAEVEHQLRVMIRGIKRVIARHATVVHPSLMPSSFVVLGWLAEFGPARASAVAEQFDIDKGAVSRQLQHLGELGLIERTPDPDDGRAQLVSVTEDGRRRLKAAHDARHALRDQQLSQWSAEDLAAFARQLARFNADTAAT